MFVTFEGPEGGGKSTALASVASRLRGRGIRLITTREPGAGPIGAKIRTLLLEGGDLPAETEVLLFLADRANHVATTIRPALAAGQIVLCDRYADSTLVYQGMSRGLDRAFVEAGNRFATGGLEPDLTLLFDLPVEVGLRRLKDPDRLDREPVKFHERVREGFLELARARPDRWAVIDAAREAEAVADDAMEQVWARIGGSAR